MEGAWIHHGLRTVLGEGTSTEIKLEKKHGDWMISFKDYKHFSVNERREPEVSLRGSFKASADNGTIQIEMPKGIESYTFTISEACLTMPAIVHQSPGVWIFESPGVGKPAERFVAECEHDPFVVPVGRVKLPRIADGLNFYVYEATPKSIQFHETYNRLEEPSYALRFMERTKNGHLEERFRFVFDRFGQPRHQRILSTGEASDDRLSIVHYFRKTDEVLDPFAPPIIEEVETDSGTKDHAGEQDGTEQPATSPESDSEGSDKPEPEAEGLSR
jgi:hypothetical protein